MNEEILRKLIPAHFFKKAEKINEDHKAQYKGVYHMKGGFLGEVLNSPITQIIGDVAAVATLNPELIPVINGGLKVAGGLQTGQSIGKSLGQGAIAGAESFGAQELGGALGNAFPETGAALGLDTSGNSLTDALGMTSGAGSFAGPGTIGGDISNLFNGGGSGALTGLTSGASPSASAASSGASGAALNASGSPNNGIDLIGGSTSPGAQLAAAANPASAILSSSPAVPIPDGGFLGNGSAASMPSLADAAASSPGAPAGGIINSLINKVTANPLTALTLAGLVAQNATTPKGTQSQGQILQQMQQQQAQQQQQAASVVSGLNNARLARTPNNPGLSTQDYYTYGSRPQSSFYNNNATPLQFSQTFAEGGAVQGSGINGLAGGQADNIDAKLSNGEFVIPADVVSGLGDGSNAAGASNLHGLMKKVRMHKTGSTKFPPKAKPAGEYLSHGGSVGTYKSSAPMRHMNFQTYGRV